MAAQVGSSTATAPIPSDLRQLCPNQGTPWRYSTSLFQRIQQQFAECTKQGKVYATLEVTEKDPEYRFVTRYFSHQKPPGLSIKKVMCIHNPAQNSNFESALTGMEVAAKTFSSTWDQEEPKAQRAKTIERWKACVAQFSPFQIPTSARTDNYVQTKIVPLWHGTKHIESICSIGFTFFGKTPLF